jgi:hypothetical protein
MSDHPIGADPHERAADAGHMPDECGGHEFDPTHARRPGSVAEELLRIGERVSALPVFDTRSPEEMLYDENGLPS